MQWYSQLADTHQQQLGNGKWSGNQRWCALEEAQPLAYTFATAALSEAEGDLGEANTSQHTGKRTLLRVAHDQVPDLLEYTYLPDGIAAVTTTFRFRQCLPWGEYGVIMEWDDCTRGTRVEICIHDAHASGRFNPPVAPISVVHDDNSCMWRDGPYTVACAYTGATRAYAAGGTTQLRLSCTTARVVIAFHTDPAQAIADARRLLECAESVREYSARCWDVYLASCPTHDFPNGYTDNATDTSIDRQTLCVRQRWHWWAVLVNVVDVGLPGALPYLAPDRAIWHGSWSNDSPDALCALTLTNEWELARRCIVQYVAASISRHGDLSWYTHAYGRGCLGHAGDSGYYSHGVPNIVHTVEFYVRHTGDDAILDASAGDGMTVWEKLTCYIRRVFIARDTNGDDLIEWANLWETGWDDKVSAFFARSTMDEWIACITRNDPTEVAALYRERACPTTALNEQVALLSALESMSRLALQRHDAALEFFCTRQMAQIQAVIEQRHWDEAEGFYFDWDVRGEQRVAAKNLDAFYYLAYAPNAQRVARMVAHFVDSNSFGLRYPPTLSADDPQFDRTGYWRGSHWPREMLYVGLGLAAQGYDELALRVVVHAICSQQGCVIAEHLNPYSGALLGTSQTMAYNACLLIALHDILGQPTWQPRSKQLV